MTLSPILRFLALVLLFIGSAAPLPAQHSMADDNSGITVSIEPLFSHLPPQHIFPVRVTISNPTNRPGRWTVSTPRFFLPIAFTYQATLEVGPGETRTFPVAVRFPPSSQLTLSIEGTGFSQSVQHSFTEDSRPRGSDSSPIAPPTLLGSATATPALQHLKEAFGKTTNGLPVVTLTVKQGAPLPEEWRDYSGFSVVVFRDTEWRLFSPVQQAALRQWVGIGGKLILLHNGSSPLPLQTFGEAAKDHPEKGFRYGFGEVRLAAIAESTPPEALSQQVSTLLKEPGTTTPLTLLPSTQFNSSLPGAIAVPKTLIAIITIAFAVLVGPVNLFFFAPAQRRAFLFVTTPLLSLGACLALIAVIFISDGTGGHGSRVAVIALDPYAKEAVIAQDQLSQTGLLLSSAFQIPPDSLLVPAEVGRTQNRPSRQLTDTTASGDWFRSRSLQGQSLRMVRPTRAAITLLPGTTPELVSTLTTPIDIILYTDMAGEKWVAHNLPTGEKMTMTRIPEKEVKRLLSDAPGAYKVPPFKPGHFLALSKTIPQDLVIETLPSIRWGQPVHFQKGNPFDPKYSAIISGPVLFAETSQ